MSNLSDILRGQKMIKTLFLKLSLLNVCIGSHLLFQRLSATDDFLCPYTFPFWDESYLSSADYELIFASQVDPYSVGSFYKLPLTDKEGKIITHIITTMSDNSIYKLLWKKNEIERMGDSIHHVHPLRFLGHIFHSQKLQNCMRTVRRSYFKWNGFMKGLSARIDQEMRHDNVLPHIYGFCDYVNADSEHVVSFVKRHDWEGLVKYLIGP